MKFYFERTFLNSQKIELIASLTISRVRIIL